MPLSHSIRLALSILLLGLGGIAAHAQPIEFGNDLNPWANDGECDDPRFEGAGAAAEPDIWNLGRDATDCRELLRDGQVTYTGGNPAMDRISISGVDFGDNTSDWAEDGSCDDPRFEGGVAADLSGADIGRDASDCLADFQAGTIHLTGLAHLQNNDAAAAGVDFGDDDGEWPFDGECDDVRFEGLGMSSADYFNDDNISHDAFDCRIHFISGQVTVVGNKSTTADVTTPAPLADLDFGDNSSMFANDGECDDPRFAGQDMAIELIEADRGHDANDCQSLYEEGLIALKAAPAESVNAISFGDDSGQWNNDGECDDPRFDGEGSAASLYDENLGRDATDCRDLFLDGKVIYLGDDPKMQQVSADGVDFGDNIYQYSDDGECDDPRFSGTGMAEQPSGAGIGHDATDCLTYYQSGGITLTGLAILQNNDPASAGVDFGDDDGEWPMDGECDDLRFEGLGMAFSEYLADANISHDASDCRAHFITGQIIVAGGTPRTVTLNMFDGINFGDDDGEWPGDGECDDTRFQGSGMAADEYLAAENDLHDASDCLDLYQTDEVTFVGHPGDDKIDSSNIDFGDDSGTWPADGECEDMRFAGTGMANEQYLTEEAVGSDATDCRSLFEQGNIHLADNQPDLSNAMFDGINFGDDNGGWPNDGECDDPRFEGSGMAVAVSLSDQNETHDATDCLGLYRAGDVQLVSGASTPLDAADLDFGDDTGDWPNDGECDDMRFSGAGMAAEATLEDINIGRDATDCRALYQAGNVELASGQTPQTHTSGVDFGTDSGTWPKDGECDDPRFEGDGMAFGDTLDDVNIRGDATDCRAQFEAGSISLI